MASPVSSNNSTRPAPASGTPGQPHERLGDMLIREKLVTGEQLQRALNERKTNGLRIGSALVKLGYVTELDLTRALARHYRMPAVDLSKHQVDPRIARLVPAEIAQKNVLLPLRREGRTLTVAMADPGDVGVVNELKFRTGMDIFPVIAGEGLLREAIEKVYESAGANEAAMQSMLDDLVADLDQDVEVVEEEDDDVSVAALTAAVDEAPVVKLINAILTDAVHRGASDIHFECFEHELRVRYRIDGALLEVMKPPFKMKAALISRFKIMANLNIAERRVPQDGR
ncbi:MAG TPA: ATPase, T2SS/T4P/T4SS family, partial [Gemmatimonadales bacterium]|nr:ATPase, T2SS/T4P/T4SS family [Gemmatimonadales bacterium]